MKSRFTLFQRGSTFYSEDSVTGSQISLRTKDEAEAQTLIHAKNEAHRQPTLNLRIAQTYLSACDPQAMTRTWQTIMDEFVRTKCDKTWVRSSRAMNDKAFDSIREKKIVETQPADLLHALEAGGVSTNVFLRRLHNFALGMNWLPWPVLAKKQWPGIRFGEKRAITADEHRRIVRGEENLERRAFYELCWHLGGAQSDVANLKAEDIDWKSRVVSFFRAKTKVAQIIQIGAELEVALRFLPKTGPLFPKLSGMREAHRATEFKRACRRAKIEGITLHSYRYAWAERAKTAGYPERFAQVALGHNSKAVHRAYAKNAQVVLPSLEEFEKRAIGGPSIVPKISVLSAVA